LAGFADEDKFDKRLMVGICKKISFVEYEKIRFAIQMADYL
jgi:hypothetical protein